MPSPVLRRQTGPRRRAQRPGQARGPRRGASCTRPYAVRRFRRAHGFPCGATAAERVGRALSREGRPGPGSCPVHPARHRRSGPRGRQWSGTLTQAIDHVPVATEDRTGYDRDLFRHWIDADGDGCDTRAEVLISEAEEAPTVGSGCSLSGGRWYSYYDGVSQTSASALDIDHMVATGRGVGLRGAVVDVVADARPTPTTSATATRWSASPPRSTGARATRTSPSGCRRSTTAAT